MLTKRKVLEYHIGVITTGFEYLRLVLLDLVSHWQGGF
jgi:hypothetical protein